MSLIDLASMVLAPTAVKDGKVYNAIPNDQDFTFSRGTEATRVNSAGLIEKARTNYLLQSNTFNTTWTNVNTSETSGQSGYDGSNDAWKLSQTATSGAHYLNQSISQSGVSTLSIYAKADEIDYIQIASASTNQQYANFDLTDGSIGNVGTRFFDAKTTSIGNGWYRLSVVNNGVSSLNGFYIVLITSKTSAWLESYSAANATDGLFIQSAQLEVGLISTPYIQTGASTAQAGILEDMPRLDYSGGATCGHLLLEPQRSNVLTNSEYVSSSDYVTGNWTGTITTNTSETLSPEGLYNATKFVKSGSTDRVYFQTSVSDGTYTGSMYFKAVSGQEGNTIEISVRRFGGGSGSTTKLITLSSEWQRVDVTATLSGGSNTAIYIADFSSSGNASSFYFYGAMLEAGSYPTSYIPTYGASVTRGADSCSKTGISSLIGQTEGTIFADFVFNGNPTSVDYSIFIIGAIGSNYITIGGYNTSLYARVFDSTLQATINALSMVKGTRYKVAVAYANNDVVMYVNGVNEGSDISASIPTLSQCSFSRPSFEAKTDINNALLFKTRLSNDELATLTTL